MVTGQSGQHGQGGLSVEGGQSNQCVEVGQGGLAKHGGAYFSAVYGSIKDPIAAPGQYEPQEC